MRSSFLQIFVAAIAIFVAVSSHASAKILTWNDCLDLASRNNADLLAAEKNLESSKSLEGTARSGFLPQISASLSRYESNSTASGGSPNVSYTSQLNLSQNLFSGFSDWNKTAQAKSNTQGAAANFVATKAKVAADLKKAFESLRYSQEYKTLTADIIKRRQENLRIVELRFQVGQENKGSVLLSQAYLEQAHLEELQARHQDTLTQTQLKKVLNLEESQEVTLEGSAPLHEPPPTEPDFEKIAMGTPDAVQAQAQERAAESSIAISRSNYFPSLDLTAAYGKTDPTFYPNSTKWNVGVSLTLPLFSGLRDYSNVQSASAKWRATSFSRSSVEKQTLVNLRLAFDSYLESVQKAKVDDSFRVATQVRAEISRKKYNNGLMTFEEWDLVEGDLINRQKAALASRRDRAISEATWEQVQGIGELR